MHQKNPMLAAAPVALIALIAGTAFGQCDMFDAEQSVDIGGGSPRALAAGDLDGDGDLDLAVNDDTAEEMVVLLNDGAGNFTIAGAYLTGLGPVGVSLGDLDGDGDLDAVVANYNDYVTSLYFNDGAANFTKVDYTTTDFCYRSAIADFDADGDNDLALIHDGYDLVAIHLNDGAGNFTPGEEILAQATTPWGIAAGNFDGMPGMDLAVGGVPYLVETLLNNGDGTFYSETTGSVSYIEHVAVADVNGDGYDDIGAAAYWGDAAVGVLINDGAAFFDSTTYWSGGWAGFAVNFAELDGEPGLELVFVNGGSGGAPGPGPVSVWLSDGLGGYFDRCNYATGDLPVGSDTGDFNGDGYNDIVTANYYRYDVSLLLNSGGGADCPPDMNGDGLVNSQDFVLFLNLFVAGDPAADFNGDGSINSQDFVAFLNAFVAGC